MRGCDRGEPGAGGRGLRARLQPVCPLASESAVTVLPAKNLTGFPVEALTSSLVMPPAKGAQGRGDGRCVRACMSERVRGWVGA